MASKSKVLFADEYVAVLEAERTLPAKFRRMLGSINLEKKVKGKKVAVQMHMGGNLGYTTIHPFFVRLLVEDLKNAGATSIRIMDGDASGAFRRGYTEEVVGCPVVSSFGKASKPCVKQNIGFKTLDAVEFSGEALACDFFLDLAHLKGHGTCGFGGAIKNIAMGMITPPYRAKVHALEGGITWHKEKCIFCLKCFRSCTHNAILVDKQKKTIGVFHHHCTYCQHCVLVCPEGAVVMGAHRFENFSEGLALVTAAFMKKFGPENMLFINFLRDITLFCDCWGFSTPPLVPDIGILASEDILAIERASLDMIKVKNVLKQGLPKNYAVQKKGNHLFEKLHGKDPFVLIKMLEKHLGRTGNYQIEEIH
jgi:uncharacterized Fe-S center protein